RSVISARERADLGIGLPRLRGSGRRRPNQCGNGGECELETAHGIPPWIHFSRFAMACTQVIEAAVLGGTAICTPRQLSTLSSLADRSSRSGTCWRNRSYSGYGCRTWKCARLTRGGEPES